MKVGVIYGGQSVEHDVSILTALQAMKALDARHSVIPIYITRNGHWLTGDTLRALSVYLTGTEPIAREISKDLSSGIIRDKIARSASILTRPRVEERSLDVVLVAAHGTRGEDGSLQGLLELCNLPYTGSSVAASAVAMDKRLTKAILRGHGLPVLDFTEILREHFADDPELARFAVEQHGLPVFVKPASLGSSIGVCRCENLEEVEDALAVVFELDRAALIEPFVENAIEANCAVLGTPGGPTRSSAIEQPTKTGHALSFSDKYLSGGKGGSKTDDSRIIPAPIGEEQTKQVRNLAAQAFSALGCSGVARVDFLIDPEGKIYVNEINTVPGSFSFYLWRSMDLSFPDLLDELLRLAVAEADHAASTKRTFPSSLLAETGPKTGGPA